MRHVCRLMICVSLAATVASMSRHYPHQIAYFNEWAGGPTNGHKHLLHSSLDWGQDLYYLKQWMADHPQARPMYVIASGHSSPRDLGIHCDDWGQLAEKYPTPGTNKNVPRGTVDVTPEWLCTATRGWCAASANIVQGARGALRGDNGKMLIVRPGSLADFLAEGNREVDRCGHSIRIYRICDDVISNQKGGPLDAP